MGCASSSPLIESGKNLVDTAKDSADEAVTKGEKALQDVGESVKETFSNEMDHVKKAVKSAMDTAEDSIGSVITKVGSNINSSSAHISEAMDDMEDEVDETVNNITDSTAEAVSEAETVLASEAENAKETITSATSQVFDQMETGVYTVHDTLNNMEGHLEDVLQIEDMDDDFHVLGDTVKNSQNKIEEIVNKLPTPAVSPAKEPRKEEPPPTFWEAAADAILHRSFSKSVDINDPDILKILATEPSDSEDITRRDIASNNGNCVEDLPKNETVLKRANVESVYFSPKVCD